MRKAIQNEKYKPVQAVYSMVEKNVNSWVELASVSWFVMGLLESAASLVVENLMWSGMYLIFLRHAVKLTL